MKTYTIISALLIVLLNALTLVPQLQLYALYFVAASLAVSLWLLLKALTWKAPVSEKALDSTEADEERVTRKAPPTKAAAAPDAPKAQAEAEVLSLLGVFQNKGRLIDFLMDDVSSYSDAQVGAAARVVQQGCKSVLQEHFTIVPVSSEKEGSTITVPEDAPADEYRLVGNVQGEPPFTGVLAHKGWKATNVKLPRVIKADGDRLPAIAPAQVELK